MSFAAAYSKGATIKKLVRLAPLSLLVFAGCAAATEPPGRFYEGKVLTLLVGSEAGGGYDAQARLLARHIGDHIPGHPAVVVQNMPGAGGLTAANFFANAAPKDGTTFSLLYRGALTAKLSTPEAVRFEVGSMNWLGSLASEPGLLIAWRTASVKTAADLLTTELIVGGAGAGNDSETSARLLNAALGAKMRIVSGYPSVNAVTLAMERGEVEGLADWALSNLMLLKPQYVRDHLVNVLLQLGVKRSAQLPDVPTPLELTSSELDRQVLKLYYTPKSVSRPVAAPPGAPPDRVSLLRTAFAQTTVDPAFLADAAATKIPIDVTPPDGLAAAVADIEAASPVVRRRLSEMLATR